MKTYNNLYSKIISLDNLYLAYKKASKNKSKKYYVLGFEREINYNIEKLHNELQALTYKPKPLKTFILRDPKTRVISKSDFRDRIVHHALVQVIEPIFDPTFIYDSYANRIGKGVIKATARFDEFKRKVSSNGKILPNNFNDNNYIEGYCLKADIKHYFDTVDNTILLEIINRKIKDKDVIWLIKQIINNYNGKIEGKGMPLGNLTSQFFANIYLNELDYFVKHQLKVKYYIRYVDDFIIINRNKEKLVILGQEIKKFLKKTLKLEIHPEKYKLINLSRGVDFLGFKNFYFFKLPRKRNIRKIENKIKLFKQKEISYQYLIQSYQGWQAYAMWADTYRLRNKITNLIRSIKYSI